MIYIRESKGGQRGKGLGGCGLGLRLNIHDLVTTIVLMQSDTLWSGQCVWPNKGGQ